MQQNIIILIGPPGGGKGSLSRLCIDNFGWLQLSTGNLCRDHISRQTEIGKKIDFIIKSGTLISDDLISEMVEDWLQSNLSKGTSVILDGYPRTVVQVKSLNNLLNNKFQSFKLNLIKLSVDEQILIKRLTSRLICSNNKCQAVYSKNQSSSLAPKKIGQCDKCKNELVNRADDEEKAIKARLSFYKNSEDELLSYFKRMGFEVKEIDATQPIESVFENLRNLIN